MVLLGLVLARALLNLMLREVEEKLVGCSMAGWGRITRCSDQLRGQKRLILAHEYTTLYLEYSIGNGQLM